MRIRVLLFVSLLCILLVCATAFSQDQSSTGQPASNQTDNTANETKPTPLPTVQPNLDIWKITHRGANQFAPENTLPAYRKAIDLGFQFIEIDVHYSRDGVPVCIHDAVLNRTTDGTGPVFILSLKELRKYDAGKWFDPAFTGTKIPTLEETLELAKGKIGIYLDQKDMARPVLIELLKKYGYLPPEDNLVVVGGKEYAPSFGALYPDYPVMPGCGTAECIDSALARYPTAYAFNTDFTTITPEFVLAAHKRGIRVFCNAMGGGDNPETIRKIIMSGADAIQTDKPLVVLDVLAEMKKQAENGELSVRRIPAEASTK